MTTEYKDLNLSILEGYGTLKIGNLTNDPILSYTEKGKPVCNFRFACRAGTQPDGTKMTHFISVAAWNDLAEQCSSNLKKGQTVVIIGDEKPSYIYKDKKDKQDKVGQEFTAWRVYPSQRIVSISTMPEDNVSPIVKEARTIAGKKINSETGEILEDLNPDDIPF